MAKAAATRPTAKQLAAALEASPRPFRNHYAGGMHLGSCSTMQSAMVTAFKHLVYGEAGAATIVDPRNNDICRMNWTSSGVTTWMDDVVKPKGTTPTRPIMRSPEAQAAEHMALTRRANAILRRVK